ILYQGPLVVADPSSESEGPGRARKIKADLLIQWEAEGPVLDLAGAVDAASRQRLEAAGAFPAGHYAQTGRFVGGHAQIGRSRVDFKSADAHRSHDWGAARDEAPAARLFARIAPDLVIDAVRVGAAGDAYAVGGLWSGGKPSALAGLELREEGGAAPRLALTARDRRGQALQVDAALKQPVNTAAEGKPEHLWALARLDVGGREGVGVVELSGRA
ncbi:MAG: hypothetical protein KC466_07100, partial [Myxococcales bacterium]|nr:hypothetical protein [Myxococcales bacterium]